MPPAAAPPAVGAGAGAVVGVVIVDGVTAVPAAEKDSPTAETPGEAAGATVTGVAGTAPPPVAFAVRGPAEAAGVPVGVGMLAGDAAGGAPVGVRMSDVAVVGAALAEVLAAAGADMKKLLEPRPLPV